MLGKSWLKIVAYISRVVDRGDEEPEQYTSPNLHSKTEVAGQCRLKMKEKDGKKYLKFYCSFNSMSIDDGQLAGFYVVSNSKIQNLS